MTSESQPADAASLPNSNPRPGLLENIMAALWSAAKGQGFRQTPTTDQADWVQKAFTDLLERKLVVVNTEGEIDLSISEVVRLLALQAVGNTARSERKKTSRRDKLLRERAEQLANRQELEPLTQIAREDLRALTWQTARKLLSDEEWAVFLLRYRDGMSDTEIASGLDLPLGTVKGRLRSALKKVRDGFGGLFDEA